ncbi:MAG: hypothetical protein ACJ8F3_15505 [Xanthobacteraceae bacterium]
MKRPIVSVLSVFSFLSAAASALAQNAPPTYQGDPAVYKVIFEDANFRVISIDRKKGVTDKPHSHPVPGIIYNVSDCSTKLHDANGQTRDQISKAGTASATPIISSHTAENIGSADCHQIIVEKK